MIEKIVFIEACIMGAALLVSAASFVGMMEKYNEYRYKLDEVDDDKVAKMCYKAFVVSAPVAVISWLSILVTGIIDIATR